MIFTLFRAMGSGKVVTYTVHETGEPAADRIDRAEELVFVKDGFSFMAALMAPVWLLLNGVWPAVVGYLVVAGALVVGLPWLGVTGFWPWLGLLALHLIIGAEADSLRRFMLSFQGWHAVGTVVGNNARECERRFFDDWLAKEPLLRRDTVGAGSRSGVSALGEHSEPVVIGAVGDTPTVNPGKKNGGGLWGMFRRPSETDLGMSRVRRWLWLGN